MPRAASPSPLASASASMSTPNSSRPTASPEEPDMDRRIVKAAELDLTSPGRRDYLVALPHDGIWGDHLIPLPVFVGPRAKPGRGLVAFGSTHGNEYEGPVAIKHLLGEIDMADVLGR